jgi:hypothetical protein
MLANVFALALALQVSSRTSPADSVSLQPTADSAVAAPADTIRRRPRAVEYSDAYNTRLTIHRWGSYTMFPLFAAEYALGQNLLNDSRPPSWIKPSHSAVALGLGALFTVNTVTGLWNLWDARDDPADRPRRYIHTALMLAADAGFAWAGATGESHSVDAERHHRAIALGSIGISTVGVVMMWLWKN